MDNNNIPTYLELKLSNTSKIFESEQVRGLSPDQINDAEVTYHKIVEALEKGEELDEGLLGGLLGGTLGALAGPAIGKAICKVLGIDEKGHMGKLLTSRLVTAAMGFALGK